MPARIGRRAQSLAKMLSSNEIAFQETTAANGVSLSPYYRNVLLDRHCIVLSRFFLHFSFFPFFSLFSFLSDRRLQVRCAGQAWRSAFIRELNVGHSFFNERFAILISRINLVVSRHSESLR